MESIVSVAIQSVAQMPVKHATNAVVGSAGVIVAPDWLGIACGIAAFMASCAFFYKTFQDIKINNRTLAKEDQESKQKPQE
jgi:glutamate dehydrogenase/leucine dehydrogenase